MTDWLNHTKPQKLQQGGNIEAAKQQLAQGIIRQDPEALKIAKELLTSNPGLLQEILAIAQQMEAQVASAKRGAKLKYLQSLKKGKAVKQKKVSKAAKGCSNCLQLKRLGGRLVNVDCYGNII